MSSMQRKLGPITVDIAGALIGVQILAKGWDKLPHFDHHPLLVASLLSLGTFVFVGSFVTMWLERRITNAHALFHAAEGVAIGTSAVLLLEQGKLRMPLLMLFVGLCYLVIGGAESRPPARRAEVIGRMRPWLGALFVAAGLVLAGSTAASDRNPWALGTAGLLVVIGAGLLSLRRFVASHGASASAPAEPTATGTLPASH